MAPMGYRRVAWGFVLAGSVVALLPGCSDAGGDDGGGDTGGVPASGGVMPPAGGADLGSGGIGADSTLGGSLPTGGDAPETERQPHHWRSRAEHRRASAGHGRCAPGDRRASAGHGRYAPSDRWPFAGHGRCAPRHGRRAPGHGRRTPSHGRRRGLRWRTTQHLHRQLRDRGAGGDGDYHQDCVDVINAWRWQCHCLPPLRTLDRSRDLRRSDGGVRLRDPVRAFGIHRWCLRSERSGAVRMPRMGLPREHHPPPDEQLGRRSRVVPRNDVARG